MFACIRKIRSPFLLAVVLLPFVVGFDQAESGGTRAKVSVGRGAYHLTGCHRDFDSEFMEGEVALKHTFAAPTAAPDSTFLQRLRPALTTLGAQADFVSQRLTIVEERSGAPEQVGDKEDARGFAGGAYVGMDWKWIGVDLGMGALLLNIGIEDAEKNRATPMLGLRLGPSDRIYATAEVNGSSPFLTGGGQVNAGLGAKFNHTRAWAGIGSYGMGQWESLGILKLQQDWGPWGITFAAQGSPKNAAPANLGIDHEYGFALGLIYDLSSLDAGK